MALTVNLPRESSSSFSLPARLCLTAGTIGERPENASSLCANGDRIRSSSITFVDELVLEIGPLLLSLTTRSVRIRTRHTEQGNLAFVADVDWLWRPKFWWHRRKTG